MKKLFIPLALIATISISSCDVLEEVAISVLSTEGTETAEPSLTEKFETTLNRAAEEATKEALPIFKSAIVGMSIQDAFGILKGGDGAATTYLKGATSSALKDAFRPKVEAAIAKVKLTEYWNPIITKYNSAMTLTGGEKLNPDLNEYVTNKAIEGLFIMVAKEENKIRLDPIARVSDILKKVFGSLGN